VPLGHSTITRPETAPEASQEAHSATVRVWGEAKDTVQVEGPLEGCKAYETRSLAVTLEGEDTDIHLWVFYNELAKRWQISVGPGDAIEVLPVQMDGGQGNSTVMATVENVQRIKID
jgi:hypothetical protein